VAVLCKPDIGYNTAVIEIDPYFELTVDIIVCEDADGNKKYAGRRDGLFHG
jgi:hypothetical protein